MNNAVVVDGPRRAQWREVPEPEIVGPRPVKITIGAVGVCGSDLLRYGHGTAYHYPLVLGHEFSAVVQQVGEDSAFRPGDKVAVFPLLPRPDDPYTKIGEWALGADYDYYGSRRDGAMQEVLWVPEDHLVPVPADMPLAHAAMVEPASVALHGVRKLTVPADGVALVIGAGPIGALAAQWLRILGWSRVLVADVDPKKNAIMADLGFEVIDAAAGDTVDAVRALTGGSGPDATVEASGLPQTFLQCLRAAAPRGQVLILGDLKADVTIERALISAVIRRELIIYGTWNSSILPTGRGEWHRVVRAIGDGSLQVRPLISEIADLAQAPEVLAAAVDRSRWTNKIIFAVSEQARRERDSA